MDISTQAGGGHSHRNLGVQKFHRYLQSYLQISVTYKSLWERKNAISIKNK